MRKAGIVVIGAFLSTVLFSQQTLVETSLVINIEVPVRVFKGGAFIDHLTIDDFEVFEGGVKQKIEAVYLVKKRDVARREERREFVPRTQRTFFLVFEVSSLTRRLQDALRYFMDEVFIEGDNLIVVTPVKTHRLRDKAVEFKTKDQIYEEMKGILRTDALAGSVEFRQTLRDIERLTQEMQSYIQIAEGVSLDEGVDLQAAGEKIVEYMGLMSRLQTFRQADQLRLMDFARYLKTRSEQNYVFIFYERKYIPQIDPMRMEKFLEYFSDEPYIAQTLSSVLDYRKREDFIDDKRVRQAFADTSTSVHFLHITTPRQSVAGIQFEEYSQETFQAFFEIVEATGGYSESSSNPNYLFQKAVAAAENYYLLYYSPKDYVSDGQFKTISVRVRNKDFKVLHRLGYYAN